MRMWMLDPDLMCMRHITGEHRELHALEGSLERTNPEHDDYKCGYHIRYLNRLAKGGYIEPKSLKKRHDKLVKYFRNHKSPINEIPTLEYLPGEVVEAKVDKEKAIRDLLDRPEACRPIGYCGGNIEERLIEKVAKIANVGIKRQKGYRYFVDENGDISRKKTGRGSRKKEERNREGSSPLE